MITTPGKTAAQGARAANCWAVASMVPRLGAGGWMPRPRKDSTASPRIAAGMATVACTRITEVALGRMCRASTQRSLAPSTTAAATKSSDLRRRVSERTTRITPGIWAMPMATAALPRLAPRMAANPTAMIRNGNASSRSVKREITASQARK